MLDITDDCLNSLTEVSAIEYNTAKINSIKDIYPTIRQQAKSPVFALTYSGTWSTLVKNCGFTEQEAKSIEENYHKMYKQSDDWAKQQLELCAKQGYIDVAFGLRIRTPLLKKSILNSSKNMKEAQAEARSVGNAFSGQSYCMLNNRAVNAFMQKVWNSPYKYNILPIALIHDAIYLMIKDDIHVLKFVNDNLIREMQWQELDELKHDKVKLGAELDVYYPDWSKTLTLENGLSTEEIQHRATEYAKLINNIKAVHYD